MSKILWQSNRVRLSVLIASMAVASLCACGGESGTRDRDRLNTQLWKGLLEKFPSDLESLCKLHDGDTQHITNCHQIQEVKPPLSSFIFANKCLLCSYRLPHLILRQIPFSSKFTQQVQEDFPFALFSARPLR